ncbi:TetR family transcriptional regulator [Kribbella deserti]|uniref:TetR family transcriptional regulator n=1 Tax=Kribbella deserti TaxID=1926257 RepID=A0ABV6QRA9_9ACTN
MVGDAEATKKRLLEAALQEFGAFGIAGARVDRIAAMAGCNKAQIYHYFDSKDGLFDAVFDQLVSETVRETPIDPADLPEYAAQLFDRYEENPEMARLATWYRLERADLEAPLDSVLAGNRQKVELIAKAQANGVLPTRFEPAVLLGLVLHQASLWSTMAPEVSLLVREMTSAERRQLVVQTVRALLRA